MKFLHAIALIILSALLCSLIFSLTTFQREQTFIALEGNSLYTENSHYFHGDFSDIEPALDASSHHYVAYQSLDNADLSRAIYSSNIEDVKFPLYSGRAIEQNDQHVALAGASVHTLHRDGRDVIDIDGVEFTVIGRLGRSADSRLSPIALLYDQSFFMAEGSSPIIIDGPAIQDLPNDQAAALEPRQDTRLERRTHADLITPAVTALTLVSLCLGSAICGVLTASAIRQRNKIGRLVGDSMWTTLTRSVLSVTAIYAAGCALSSIPRVPSFIRHDIDPDSFLLLGGSYILAMTVTISQSAMSLKHKA